MKNMSSTWIALKFLRNQISKIIERRLYPLPNLRTSVKRIVSWFKMGTIQNRHNRAWVLL